MLFNFLPSLKLLLQSEKGFVNSSEINGGPTNLGVTIPAWSEWIKRQAHVTDIKALTPTKVQPFYKVMYWDQVKGDVLPAGIDYCVFDCGVQSGPERAVILLQKALGIPEDATFGPVTGAAVKGCSPPEFIKEFSFLREKFEEALPNFHDNSGWLPRIASVRASALAMVAQEAAHPDGQQEGPDQGDVDAGQQSPEESDGKTN